MEWKSEVTREDLSFEVTKKTLFVQKVDGEYINLREHKVAGMKHATDRVALWNERDNQLLGVVSGKKYNAVPHGKILDSLYEALDNLRLEPKATKIMATPNYNQFWIDINLDAKHVDIGDDRDDWDVGVSISHGLDGTHALATSSFLSREVCSNGMRTKNMLGSESKTHRYNNLVEWFENKVTTLLVDLDTKFQIIPKMFEVTVQRDEFLPKVEKIFGKRFMIEVEEQINNPSSVNPLYRVTKESLSLYDAMSSLTYINQIRADKIGARGLDIRYGKIENVINGYMKNRV